MELLETGISTAGTFIFELSSFLAQQTFSNIDAVVRGFTVGGKEAVDAMALPLVILSLQLFSLTFTLRVLRMIWVLSHEVKHVWKRPKAYSAVREGGKRILILGDSTAYGIGADKPEDTIAGRLGHDFPQTNIINMAVNGSLTRDAIRQLHRAGTEKFDLVIICTGGNDIWRFSGLARLERDLERLLKEASEKSGRQVALLYYAYANFAQSSIFPGIIRSVLFKRTQRVHEIFKRVAEKEGVPLVELYASERDDDFSPNPFVDDPERYYTSDRMHPSSEGYRLWYNRMWGEIVARHFTFAEERPVISYMEKKPE